MTQPTDTPQPVYRIAAWDSTHETAESRKYKTLSWFAKPNKHDGLGFRRMVASPERCELYACWCLILDVASKGPRGIRGYFWRDDKPLNAEDLAVMTGFPVHVFIKAIPFFLDTGWLISGEPPNCHAMGTPVESPAAPGESSSSPVESPATRPADNSTGQNSTKVPEEKGAVSKKVVPAASSSSKAAPEAKPKSVIQFAALRASLRDHPGQLPGAEPDERKAYRELKKKMRELQAKQAAGDI